MSWKALNIFVTLLVLVIYPKIYGQKPNLDSKIQYNLSKGSKNTKRSNQFELSVQLKDNPVQGIVLSNSLDSILFNHLSIVSNYAKNQINYIQRQPFPYITLDKDHNSYAEQPVQMLGSPSAQTIGVDRLNLSSHYVFLYKVNYGITERWDLGAGFTLLPNLNDSSSTQKSGQLGFLSTKLKIRDKKHIDVAIGLNSYYVSRHFSLLRGERNKVLHFAYIAANADYSLFNFSASLGNGYIGSYPIRQYLQFYFEEDYQYTFTLAGSLLISDQISIISENWWINGIFNTPNQVNRERKGLPDFPLIGGRYYNDVYGASIGFGNFLLPGVNLLSAFYIDGFYYF